MKKNVCVVPGCLSTDASNDSVRFHQIPKDAEVRKKWLKAINRTEPEINKRSKVCSKHFKSHDYAITKLNYTKNATAGSEIKSLKNEAVPNHNLPQKSTFKIKISKKDSVKQIKVEEVKVKEEKPDKPEKSEKLVKVKMPKRSAIEMSPPRSRTQSRRAASKEALKQMQLLLDDENDTVEIPDDDIIPIDPSPLPPPPPKKKYKLSHRKSSDGNDRDVIVLKTITNRDAENTLELDCWVEQLEDIQKQRIQKFQDEEAELQAKLDQLVNQSGATVIHKGDLNTVIEVSEQVQNAIQGSQTSSSSLILNNNLGAQQSYQLVVDPRVGLVVGAISPQAATGQQKVYQGKVQVAQNLQQTPTTPSNVTPTRTVPRTRNRAGSNKNTPTPTVLNSGRNQAPAQARGQTTPPTRTQVTPGQTRASLPQTRGQASIPQTRGQATIPQTRGQATVQTRQATPVTRGQAGTQRTVQQKKAATPVISVAANTRGRAPPGNTFTTNVRPDETNVQGGLATGGKKVVVDLTADEGNKSAPDSREIAFNKLQGKTYPSLVVVARPHLRVQDLSLDRPKLDAKVKSVLMHAPTKFTEWLIQQGLIRSEQKCSVHTNNLLKLGMYSDVSKFPYSGGYVWISECCPQRFVSVFSGSLFEGSPHPPMIILKLLYHWSCQTNIQNVTQWVKVDNLYVKGMFTWLRSICTVALHTHIRQIGGPGIKVEVGVISLGTTSQDGNQRQVKVEVLGVLESDSKLIRLRAVEPQVEGDRNYKKRFSKILEPVSRWVHPQSILVADLTVDKQTLMSMGFQNVVQYSSNQYGNNNQIMEYLRRIVPRMFQNTLSLLSRQIIQQFLDELVWREWFGTSSLAAFDNLVTHLSEQTRFESGSSLIVRLNKVAQNPFKSWAINTSTPAKAPENAVPAANTTTNKKQRNTRKPEPPKVVQPVAQDARPPKSTSPDVPEHMVPLESYYYGTIDTYSKTPKITLNMKCPFCKSTFDNNIQLMSHLFKHAHNVSMDAQLCRYCLTSVATANDLLKHISTSHPAETKFDNGFCCLICETQYMNPFVLGKHMSKEHYPSELPYQCGTCSYRCSNHKQAIDHFYKTHDNGPTIQCPFCLKSTTVFTSSRNIVQNMNYFIQHLQKHQRKLYARRCGKCNLWFVQKDVLKDHQTKMHVSQRGKSGLVPWTAPRNGVMVPKSKMDKYPVDAEVINFAALNLDLGKGLMCKECSTLMDTPKHFPSFESCQNPNCQYSTCCTNAMQEHNAKCSKTANPVAEEKLPFEMFCICGFSNQDGNQMARHLAICERKSAYPSRTDAKGATVTHSMLDVLGLVRKNEEKPKARSKKLKKDASFDKVKKTTEDTPKNKKDEDVEMLKDSVKSKNNDEGENNLDDAVIIEETDDEKKTAKESPTDKEADPPTKEIDEKSEKDEEKMEVDATEFKEEDLVKDTDKLAAEKDEEDKEIVKLPEDQESTASTKDVVEESKEEEEKETESENQKASEPAVLDELPRSEDLEEKEKPSNSDKAEEPSQSEDLDKEPSSVEGIKETSQEDEAKEETPDSADVKESQAEDIVEAQKELSHSKDVEDAQDESRHSEDLEEAPKELTHSGDIKGVQEESRHSEDLEEAPKELTHSGDVDNAQEESRQSEGLEEARKEPPQSEDVQEELEEPRKELPLEDVEDVQEESRHSEELEETRKDPPSEDLDDAQKESTPLENLEEETRHFKDLEEAQKEPALSEELEEVEEETRQSTDLDSRETPSEDLEEKREEVEMPEKEIEDAESKETEEIVDTNKTELDKLETEFRNHFGETENSMETSETSQEKGPAITSDDIQNILSDVVGENEDTSNMETDGSDGKHLDDVNMTSPSEMMEVGGEAPSPMETD